MNLQITNAIARATDSTVSYETRGTDTIYILTKSIGKLSVTVPITVSAELHAQSSSAVIHHVTQEAAKLFAEARKESAGVKSANVTA